MGGNKANFIFFLPSGQFFATEDKALINEGTDDTDSFSPKKENPRTLYPRVLSIASWILRRFSRSFRAYLERPSEIQRSGDDEKSRYQPYDSS
jgi:hypothetical protein